MNIVYVLITCDRGFEKSIITELKTINLVKEIKEVMGDWDILVKLESNKFDEFKNIIPFKIHKIPNIISMLTIIVES